MKKAEAKPNDLYDGSKKSESIFNGIAIINSLNDTSKINFYEGKQKIQIPEIKYLSDNFCDNVLLYLITERDFADKIKQNIVN